MGLEIKTAEGLIDPALEARWGARQAARQTDILQLIRRTPIPVEGIVATFPNPRDAVSEALIRLDEED